MTLATPACAGDPPVCSGRNALPDTRTIAAAARWRAPLLCVVLAVLYLLSFTGFARFFARPIVPESLGPAHLWIGVATLLPLAVYQIGHVRRALPFWGAFHFWLGVGAMATFLLTVLSGLIEPIFGDTPQGTIMLAHVLASFAFLIVLSAHLAVVGWREMARRTVTSAFLWRRSVLLPGALGLFGTALLWWAL